MLLMMTETVILAMKEVRTTNSMPAGWQAIPLSYFLTKHLRNKFLANIYTSNRQIVSVGNLPADGQQLFTPPNHKEYKTQFTLCIHYCHPCIIM